VDEVWQIPTAHFDPQRARQRGLQRPRLTPIEEILVEGSTFNRSNLKQRLYEAGLKARACELCGQGEEWRGQPMSLILDHINGVPNDNRLENLRIVCPNCAATLSTHCGRKNRLAERACERCGKAFQPRQRKQRYCSVYCGARHNLRRRTPKPQRRKVARPTYAQLLADLDDMSVVAVGRKYGVSDNAVRKWVRWYAYQEELREHGEARGRGADASDPDAPAA
jgi:hypothetical protein